jgi:hypothetical protein
VSRGVRQALPFIDTRMRSFAPVRNLLRNRCISHLPLCLLTSSYHTDIINCVARVEIVELKRSSMGNLSYMSCHRPTLISYELAMSDTLKHNKRQQNTTFSGFPIRLGYLFS